MANKKRGQVAVKFNGERLKLSLTFNSFCELEDYYGMDITAIIAKYSEDAANNTASLKDARALIWGAMLEELPDASLKDAGALSEQLGHEKLGETIAEVLNNCGLFDAPDKGQGGASGKPPGKKPSTA